MQFIYKILPGFLTKEECDLLLDFSLKNLKLHVAELANTTDETVKTYNKGRKSNIAWHQYYETFPFLYEKLSKVLIDEISVKGFDLDYLASPFQFTEYKVGDYFNWHRDSVRNIVTQEERYCSMVIQLNNNYDGGDLELKLENDHTQIKVEKGIGDLIIFLSNLEHRVTDVTSGNRYTLVNWVGLKHINNFKKTLL
jgi:Rps23 Pro-64 3,4-dihydroxylase Tpa1-like proline 4-hydroxylase